MPGLVSFSDEMLVATTAPGTQWVHHKHCWMLSGLFPSHRHQWTEAAMSSFPTSPLWTTSSPRQDLSEQYSLAFQKGPASTGMSSKPSRPFSQVIPLGSSQTHLLHLDILSGLPSAWHSFCPSEYKQPWFPSFLANTVAVLGGAEAPLTG